jgi:hypothetical protein
LGRERLPDAPQEVMHLELRLLSPVDIASAPRYMHMHVLDALGCTLSVAGTLPNFVVQVHFLFSFYILPSSCGFMLFSSSQLSALQRSFRSYLSFFLFVLGSWFLVLLNFKCLVPGSWLLVLSYTGSAMLLRCEHGFNKDL